VLKKLKNALLRLVGRRPKKPLVLTMKERELKELMELYREAILRQRKVVEKAKEERKA